jgi:protein translocase SecG subunit
MRYFIAANWKMHKTVGETREFLASFLPMAKDAADVDIVIAPPFTALSAAAEGMKGGNVQLSAQDVFWEEKGAYTGEVAPGMLLDAGCRHVIVGHSERRQHFFEDDVAVNRKIRAAKKAGLAVIFCVGETLEERETGRTFEVIKREVEAGLTDPYSLRWKCHPGKRRQPYGLQRRKRGACGRSQSEARQLFKNRSFSEGEVMFTFVLIIHVIVSFFLILIVLVQGGKGAELGAAFGGSSQTLFGARGAATIFGKLTTVAAVVFMLTTLTLAIMVVSRVPVETQQQRSMPRVPGPVTGPVQGAPSQHSSQPTPAAPAPSK